MHVVPGTPQVLGRNFSVVVVMMAIMPIKSFVILPMITILSIEVGKVAALVPPSTFIADSTMNM